MSLLTYFLRRTGRAVVVVFGLVVVTFVLTRAVTDPVNLILGVGSTAEQRAALRAQLGLDQPIPEQFVDYVVGVVQGDLGVSLWQNVPALPLIVERMPASLALAGAATALALVIGLTLGLLGGLKPGSRIDRLSIALSALAVAIPDFWLGIVVIIIFAVELGWLPTAGYGGIEHLILPAATLSLRPAGRLAQVARDAVTDEMTKQYIVAARARGLTTSQYVVRHIFKNIAVPVTTIAGFDFLLLFAGYGASLEVVFGWPGIGRLAVDAVIREDVVLMTALVVVTGLIVSVGNILLDMLHATIDRRIVD